MIITKFELDLSSLPASGETRNLTIIGGVGAEFILEISNEDNHYYNFVTQSFQSKRARLESFISTGVYKDVVKFPAVGDNDEYNISLYAKPGTTHIDYTEVRFLDGTLDINSSTGSNSLMLYKVIYQYTALTLGLRGYSVGGTVSGTTTTDNIAIDSGGSKTKTPFSFTFTASATAAYRILKQPVANDVLSFLEPTVGSAPETLPGENIYPTKTATGNTNAVMSSTVTITMADTIEELGLKIGDKVIQAIGPFFANIVTVVAISGGGLSVNQFTASEAISVGSGVRLDFYNQMNYRWPLDSIKSISPGMIVVPDTNVAADTVVSDYKDTITIFADTNEQEIITKNQAPALDTKNQKPTIVNGEVTVQLGSVVFNKQQVLALAGDSLKIGGYGEEQVLNVYGYEVILSDLAMTLSVPSTATTEATSAHATIAVADREGVINNFSRVGGIGINPALQNPLITSGGGADGAGDWVMDAVQTLETGVTLTIENTGRVATITGNIEIIKAGNASAVLRFDVDRLLSTSAPS